MPVPSAVELVREPAGSLHLAVDMLLGGAAVGGGGGGGGVVTVGITLVTDRAAATVSEVVVVTAQVKEIKHLRVAVLVVRTEEVFSVQAGLTAPVAPAVVRVGVVTSAQLVTVHPLVLWSTVRLRGCGGQWRRTVNVSVWTGPGAAVHV